MKVFEVMIASKYSWSPGDSLAKVVQAMAGESTGCVVISDEGKPVGMLSSQDVLRLLAEGRLVPGKNEPAVAEVMQRDLLTVNSEAPLAEALQLFDRHKLEYLPVVDNFGLQLGILSASLLLQQLIKTGNQANNMDVAAEASHWLSLEDKITGLPNRRAMEIDLRQTEAIATRRNEVFGLAVIEVDYLKQVADRDVSDQLLAEVAKVFKARIRASDKAFRYSSTEFVYLMPGTPAEGAFIATDRLRQAVEAGNIANPASPSGTVSITAGIAARQRAKWQELLKSADSARLRAKDTGHNTVLLAEAGTTH